LRLQGCTPVPGLTLKSKTVESEGVPHLEACAWEYRIQRTAYLSLLMVSKDSIKGNMRKKKKKRKVPSLSKIATTFHYMGNVVSKYNWIVAKVAKVP
jgi:hypothetical protein